MVDLYMESIPSPKMRHIVGEKMIRSHAAERLHVSPESVSIHHKPNGKPFIYSLHFNLSHSGKWAACAFADTPIGVDIEQIDSANIPLAKRFFHANEIDHLLSAPKEQQDLLFFQIWTKKEAYLKCSGLGIAGGLDRFDVFSLDPSLFHTAVINDTYCLAICTSHPTEIGSYPSNILWDKPCGE